jgi:hypothetical protein
VVLAVQQAKAAKARGDSYAIAPDEILDVYLSLNQFALVVSQ